MNASDGEVRPVDMAQAEDTLIVRPETQVEVRRVPPGGATFVAALRRSATLGALGTLGMTAIIFLTYPEHWPSEGLPWIAMSLTIMAFGPGRIALDALVARLVRH